MRKLINQINLWQGLALAFSLIVGSGMLGLPGITIQAASNTQQTNAQKLAACAVRLQKEANVDAQRELQRAGVEPQRGRALHKTFTIVVTGFSEEDLAKTDVYNKVEEQLKQLTAFQTFVYVESHKNGEPPPFDRIEIRPTERRRPWTAFWDGITGYPHRLLQYPNTKTLFVHIPSRPFGEYRPIQSNHLIRDFYRYRHLVRGERIAALAAEVVDTLGERKRKKLTEIREELTPILAAAAESARNLIGELIGKLGEGSQPTAAALRVSIGGIVDLTMDLEPAERRSLMASLEDLDAEAFLKLLPKWQAQLDGKEVIEQILGQVEQQALAAMIGDDENLVDWRLVISPVFVEVTDRVHVVASSEPGLAGGFIRVDAKKKKRRLKWIIRIVVAPFAYVATDDDIAVTVRVVRRGTETLLALQRVLAEMRVEATVED